MVFLSFLLTFLLPALSTAVRMDMSVAWFNTNDAPGTCTSEEGAAISEVMVPALAAVMKGLSVLGGGAEWDLGDDEDRRNLHELSDGEEALRSESNEKGRELCGPTCAFVCSYSDYQCRYVFNCCRCGYCRRLSPLAADADVSTSVVASSLEIACVGILEDIVSSQLKVELSSACMDSLKGSECKANAILDD